MNSGKFVSIASLICLLCAVIAAGSERGDCYDITQTLVLNGEWEDYQGPVNNVSCMKTNGCRSNNSISVDLHFLADLMYTVDHSPNQPAPFFTVKLKPSHSNLTVNCCLIDRMEYLSCITNPVRQIQGVMKSQSVMTKAEATCEDQTINITCWFDDNYFAGGCLVALISGDGEIMKLFTFLKMTNEIESLTRVIPRAANISSINFYGLNADYSSDEEAFSGNVNISLKCLRTSTRPTEKHHEPESGNLTITVLSVLVGLLFGAWIIAILLAIVCTAYLITKNKTKINHEDSCQNCGEERCEHAQQTPSDNLDITPPLKEVAPKGQKGEKTFPSQLKVKTHQSLMEPNEREELEISRLVTPTPQDESHNPFAKDFQEKTILHNAD